MRYFFIMLGWIGWRLLSAFAMDHAHLSQAKTLALVVTQYSPIVTITLPSNPTTGYQWQLIRWEEQYLSLLEHHYVPPQNHRVGAGNVEIWQFAVKPAAFEGSRLAVIKMQYQQ